jgi:hypothetical protein
MIAQCPAMPHNTPLLRCLCECQVYVCIFIGCAAVALCVGLTDAA